jgi:hypothetical protein
MRVKETDGGSFFKLLKRAAQPHPKLHAKSSGDRSSADCNGKQIHSRNLSFLRLRRRAVWACPRRLQGLAIVLEKLLKSLRHLSFRIGRQPGAFRLRVRGRL